MAGCTIKIKMRADRCAIGQTENQVEIEMCELYVFLRNCWWEDLTPDRLPSLSDGYFIGAKLVGNLDFIHRFMW